MVRFRRGYFIVWIGILLQPEPAHMQLRCKSARRLLFMKDQAAATHANLPILLAALQQGLNNNVRGIQPIKASACVRILGCASITSPVVE